MRGRLGWRRLDEPIRETADRLAVADATCSLSAPWAEPRAWIAPEGEQATCALALRLLRERSSTVRQ